MCSGTSPVSAVKLGHQVLFGNHTEQQKPLRIITAIEHQLSDDTVNNNNNHRKGKLYKWISIIVCSTVVGLTYAQTVELIVVCSFGTDSLVCLNM